MKKIILVLTFFCSILMFIETASAGYYNFKSYDLNTAIDDILRYSSNNVISRSRFNARTCLSHRDGDMFSYATANVSPGLPWTIRHDVMIDVNWDNKITWEDFQVSNGYLRRISDENINDNRGVARNGKINCAQYDGQTGDWTRNMTKGSHILKIRYGNNRLNEAKRVEKKSRSIIIQRRRPGGSWVTIRTLGNNSDVYTVYNYFRSSFPSARTEFARGRVSYFDPNKNPNRYEFRVIQNLQGGGRVESIHKYGLLWDVNNSGGIGSVEGGDNTLNVSTIARPLWSDDTSVVIKSPSLGGSGFKKYKLEYQKQGDTSWRVLQDTNFSFRNNVSQRISFIQNTLNIRNDGVYNLRVFAQDHANNEVKFLVRDAIKVDTTAPNTTVNFLPGPNQNNKTAVITCSDTMSGCGPAPSGWTKNGDTYSKVISISSQVFDVNISDVVGNIKTTTVDASSQIDTTAPTGDVTYENEDGTSYVPGTWTNQKVRVNISCSDTGSGCGSAPSGWTKSGNTYTRLFSSSIGNQSLTIQDISGNTASINYGNIQIDTTPPTVIVTYTQANGSMYTPGDTTNQQVTISFNCTDNQSGCSSSNPGPITVSNSSNAGLLIFRDNAGNTTNVSYGAVTIYDLEGIQVSGNTSSQNTSQQVNDTLGNEVRVMGNISKSSLRQNLEKNVYQVIKPFINKSTAGIVSNYVGNTWNNLDGEKILGDTVLYFDGNSGSSVQLNAGNISGRKTIVINEGNAFIRGNILSTSQDDILGIVVLNGHVFIHPDVTDIHAVIYAKKSLMSSINGVSGIEAKSQAGDLGNQLYIKGAIFSENTLGGSDLNPVKCPFYVQNCNSISAAKYDFNYLRGFYSTIDGDGNTVESGNKSIGGTGDFPVIIDYNALLQTSPPPLFSE